MGRSQNMRSGVSDMFARRANASEASAARDADKEKLLKLRDYLKREGYLKPRDSEVRSTTSVEPTIDILAEIAGKEIPMPRRLDERYAQPDVHIIKVEAPSSTKAKMALNALPGQTKVMADIYHQHLGKRNWLQALIGTIEPKLKAVSTTPSRPLSRIEALRIERSSK